MEFRDKGAEVVGGNLLKNRYTLIIAALVGLGVIGVLALLLVVFGIIPPGRRPAGTGAQATGTRIFIAQGTTANTSAASTAIPSAVAPAPTDTPVPIPTITPPAATPPGSKVGTPAANLAQPSSPLGLYVDHIRVDPAKPSKNELIKFYVTLTNATEEPQVHKVCVETYRPGDFKSFGITSCPPQTILPGTNEVMAGGWVVAGIHECIAVRARALVRDEDEVRIPLQQTGGAELWLDLQVCP